MDYLQYIQYVAVACGVMCLIDCAGAVLRHPFAAGLLRRRFPAAAAQPDAQYFTAHWLLRYVCCGLAAVTLCLAEWYGSKPRAAAEQAEWPVIAVGLVFFALLFVLLAFASYWHGAVLAGDKLYFAGIAPWQTVVAPVGEITVDGGENPSGRRRDIFRLYNVYRGEDRRYSSMLPGLGMAVRLVAPKAAPLAAVHFGQVVVAHVVESVAEAVHGKKESR